MDGRFGPLACRRRAPAGRRHPRSALPREACRGSTSRPCAWTSSAGAPCSSSSGTSAVPARCARSPTSRRGTSATRADGLRVVTVHSPGFAPGEDEAAVRAAVARLQIEHPVCIDLGFELWRAYDNEGWPARYLWDGDGHLAEYHYGEGGYAETELAIQELLGTAREPLGAGAPRGRAQRADRGPDARPARRLQRPVRRRRGVGRARRRRRAARQRRAGRRRVARRAPARRACPPRRGRARPARRRRA